MDIKLLEKYVKLCRKYGIETFKIADIEIKLGEIATKQRVEVSAEIAPAPLMPQYSDMDMLLWSSGGIPNEVNNA